MSKNKVYRYVRTSFWDDEKVLETLTPEQRYFYLFLMTNPDSTQLGVFKLHPVYTLARLGWSNSVMLEDHINAMESKGFIVYDKDTKEIGLLNWHKYNYTKSPSVIKCIATELESVKSYKVVKSMQEVCKIQEVKNVLISKQKSLKLGGKNWCVPNGQLDVNDGLVGCQLEVNRGSTEGQPSQSTEIQEDTTGYREKGKIKKENNKKENTKSSSTSFFDSLSANKELLRKDILKKIGRKWIVANSDSLDLTADEIIERFVNDYHDKYSHAYVGNSFQSRGIKKYFQNWIEEQKDTLPKKLFELEPYEEVYKKVSKCTIEEGAEKELKAFVFDKSINLEDFEKYLRYLKRTNRLLLSNIYSTIKDKNYYDYTKGLSEARA